MNAAVHWLSVISSLFIVFAGQRSWHKDFTSQRHKYGKNLLPKSGRKVQMFSLLHTYKEQEKKGKLWLSAKP